MGPVLFLDACMRGPELSRTFRLCRHFLREYTALHPGVPVLHRELGRCELPLLTGELARQRESWVKRQPDHPLLAPARETACAGLILVGAPYWDLSFPAALKVYLEWASVKGITFRYDREGRQVGMARAGHLVYVTTGGGPMDGCNYGYDYVKALGAMFGVGGSRCVAAQGLDVWGNDPEALLLQAEEALSRLAGAL